MGLCGNFAPKTLVDFFFNQRMLFNDFVTETVRCQYVLTFTRESKHEHKIFKEPITVTKEQLDFKTFENVKHKTF